MPKASGGRSSGTFAKEMSLRSQRMTRRASPERQVDCPAQKDMAGRGLKSKELAATAAPARAAHLEMIPSEHWMSVGVRPAAEGISRNLWIGSKRAVNAIKKSASPRIIHLPCHVREEDDANRPMDRIPMPAALLSHILLTQAVRQKQVGIGHRGR